MLALLNYLMHTETYLTSYKQRNQCITYHFARVRQFKNLAKINQEIISIIHGQKIEPILKIQDARWEVVPIIDRSPVGKERKIWKHVPIPSMTFPSSL
jgi:hypothetical protein